MDDSYVTSQILIWPTDYYLIPFLSHDHYISLTCLVLSASNLQENAYLDFATPGCLHMLCILFEKYPVPIYLFVSLFFILGIELTNSCFPGRHLFCWAISPAPYFSYFLNRLSPQYFLVVFHYNPNLIFYNTFKLKFFGKRKLLLCCPTGMMISVIWPKGCMVTVSTKEWKYKLKYHT